MRVSGFMIPKEKVISVSPTDTVRKVMDLMLEFSIGAIVVIREENKIIMGEDGKTHTGETMSLPMPMGIITKSDIMKAYADQVNIDAECTTIMSGDGTKELITCVPSDDRDKVASLLEIFHTHHVIVVDEKHAHFVGLVSSYDIAAECAKDNRAWPYLRNEETGEIEIKVKERKPRQPPPPAPFHPEKPTTIENHKHDEFTTYMDDLDLMGFQ